MENDGYGDLAHAIIKQAVADYTKSYIFLRDNKDNHDVDFRKIKVENRNIKSIEKFFKSEWFEVLSGVNGDFLLQKLKEEIGRESQWHIVRRREE